MSTDKDAPPGYPMAENWVMVVSEMHRYQGVSYKSDIIVISGPCYNPLDVMNCLMTRRGYKVQGNPQQRTLPNIHNKDDKFAMIYHMSKEVARNRADTMPALPAVVNAAVAAKKMASSSPKKKNDNSGGGGLNKQASDLRIK